MNGTDAALRLAELLDRTPGSPRRASMAGDLLEMRAAKRELDSRAARFAGEAGVRYRSVLHERGEVAVLWVEVAACG